MPSEPKPSEAAKRLAMMFQQAPLPELEPESELPHPSSSHAAEIEPAKPRRRQAAAAPVTTATPAPTPAPAPSRPRQPTKASNPARPAMPGRAGSSSPQPASSAGVTDADPSSAQARTPTPVSTSGSTPNRTESTPSEVREADKPARHTRPTIEPPFPATDKPKLPSKLPASSGTAAAIRAKMLAKQIEIYRTMIPTCLVLGMTLPVLAGLWFVVDPAAVVRKLPLWVPLLAGALGLASLTTGGLLMSKVSQHLQKKAFGS